MPDRLCLLCVHAHPDDEASKGAPTVARYHAEGVRTVLVCCTGGEEGDILNPAMDTPEVRADIGRIRMAELKAATDIIGYDETVLLGYRDSGMPDIGGQHAARLLRPGAPRRGGRAPGGRHPPGAPPGRSSPTATTRTSTRIRTTCGSTRSPSLAFDAAGDPDRFPDAGPPFTPAKLYYSVWSAERFRQIHAKFVELGLEVTLRRQVAGAHDARPSPSPRPSTSRASPTCGARR